MIQNQIQTKYDKVKLGYVAAGLTNLFGILIFSKGFTNLELNTLYPEVFSNFGMMVIMIWGLAYLSVSHRWREERSLAAVFALEKLVYVVSWVYWIYFHHSEFPQVFEASPLTGFFYIVYGPSDFLFLILFVYSFLNSKPKA